MSHMMLSISMPSEPTARIKAKPNVRANDRTILVRRLSRDFAELLAARNSSSVGCHHPRSRSYSPGSLFALRASACLRRS
jgi:hypothetical protein